MTFSFKLSQMFAVIEAVASPTSEYGPVVGTYEHVVKFYIPYKAGSLSDFPPGCEYELRGNCICKEVKLFIFKA